MRGTESGRIGKRKERGGLADQNSSEEAGGYSSCHFILSSLVGFEGQLVLH